MNNSVAQLAQQYTSFIASNNNHNHKWTQPNWERIGLKGIPNFNFFIVVPCILISTEFMHKQMLSLLNLTKF